MATLPPKSNFTDTNVKQGGFRAALDQLRDYLAGLLGEQGTASQARATLGLGALATRSSVGTSQIDDLAVSNSKLASGAVSSSKLASGAVSSSKVAWGSAVGSRSISSAGSWVMPAGLYMVFRVGGDLVVQVRDSGNWYTLGMATSVGAVFSDGANMRVLNNGPGTLPIYYRQLA